MSSPYTEYTSKSGTEIQAVFNDQKFGDLQMVKYATQRDTANIHLMGHVDAVGTASGKRATTGACIFTVFEKDRLLEALNTGSRPVFLTNHELVNYGDGQTVGKMMQTGQRPVSTFRPDQDRVAVTANSIWAETTYGQFSKAMMVDQIPPFDITLVGISEVTGHLSMMTIHGVKFNSDQGGTSIDDLVLERSLTFLARRVTPWRDPKAVAGGSGAANPQGLNTLTV